MSKGPSVRQAHRPRKPPITEIISNCPDCGKFGQVIHSRNDGTVEMFCADCNRDWLSLSYECSDHDCKQPNGYVVPGLCAKCYLKKKEAAEIERYVPNVKIPDMRQTRSARLFRFAGV